MKLPERCRTEVHCNKQNALEISYEKALPCERNYMLAGKNSMTQEKMRPHQEASCQNQVSSWITRSKGSLDSQPLKYTLLHIMNRKGENIQHWALSFTGTVILYIYLIISFRILPHNAEVIFSQERNPATKPAVYILVGVPVCPCYSNCEEQSV